MDAVEDIKNRLAIEDVVGRYVDLKRSGASYKGLCPFHQEKTPSFYVTPARGTYHCFGCLEEHELIWTSSGLKPIADVQIDDCVLDAFGAMNRVCAKEVKWGELVGIETAAFRGDPLLLTPDHTCLIVRGDNAVANVCRVARDAERGVKFYGRDGSYRDNRSAQLAEVEARDVALGDFFVFPIIPPERRANRPLTDPSAIRTYTFGPRTQRIVFLPVNEQAAWLYGLWLAEGSTARGFIRFSFSITERHTLAQQAADAIREEFGCASTVFEYPGHNLCEVICSKTDLEHQFKHWFGRGAAGKRIPLEAMHWSPEVQLALVRGYLDGDGDKKHRVSATVSQPLAYGLFAIAVQCRLLPSIGKGRAHQSADGVLHKAAWSFFLRERQGLAGFYEPIDGGMYYWSRVRKISPLHENSRVVDITVANSSTFVTKMGATHNCGKGGDLFNFVMEMERLPFPEALKRLADQAGVALPERRPDKPSLTAQLVAANEAATQFFREALRSAQGERARRYLQDRHFDEQAINMFDLGYAPDGREALAQHLRTAGFDERAVLTAGLAVQDELGGKVRDRFRGRLMFPIRDRSGRVVGFGGRTLGDAQPKYMNSPQTELFDKSSVLFGIQLAQDAIREAQRAVLVEGYLDAVRAHLAGYPNTVASLGTAVTAQQLAALGRMTETVILALDPDPAGSGARATVLAAEARKSLTALAVETRRRGRSSGSWAALDLRIAPLPEGHGDPDELLRNRPDLWEQALAESVPAFDFYFAQTLAGLDRSSQAWRQEAIDRLLPVIQQFAALGATQGTWIQRLAAETGIDAASLQRTVLAAQPARPRARTSSRQGGGREIVSATTAQALTTDPGARVERELMALLLRFIVIPAEARRLLDSAELMNTEHREILERLLEWQRTGNFDYEMFRDALPESLHETADGLRALDVPPPDEGKLSVAVAYHLARLRQFRIRAEETRASQLLHDVDAEGQAKAVESLRELMQKRQQVEQDLDRLSKLILQAGALTVDQGTIDHDSGRL